MHNDQEFIDCPHCGGTVRASAGVEPFTCPHCGESVAIALEECADSDDSERGLDANRIRQLAQLRRATMRTRSYLLIATIVCIVAAIQCASMLWGVRQPALWNVMVVLLLSASCFGAIVFARKAMRMR